MSNPTQLLQDQIQRADALMQLPRYSPQYKVWFDTTVRILQDNFNNEYVEMFRKISSKGVTRRAGEAELRRAFVKMLVEKVQLLQSIINEYNRFQGEPAVDISRSSPLQTYDWHKEIKNVSLKLYEDKHYSQAVEEAFKRVIQEVKRIVKEKVGQEYDGDDLVNRAFSPQNPIIKFNQLQTTQDTDEQKGMMFLFKGMVAIRNRKAHTNAILDDPVRATEYLSLASLLMRLLDQFAI
jgi:uncharacterized protein (TIGR02391 family)